MRELPPIEAKVLPFRRPATAVRVRRRSASRVVGRPFLQAFSLVVLPTLALAWTFTAPLFGLAGVDVSGNRYVTKRWVEGALEPYRGENLFRLPLEAVEATVRANPWIATVTVDKVLPNRLRVVLVEKQPMALLREGDALEFLDATGQPIAPYDAEHATGDLLLVSVATLPGEAAAGAYAIAEELARVRSDWAKTLSEVEILGDGDFRLRLGALPFPLLVRAGTLAERLPALARLLPDIERRYDGVREVDLRFPRRIVFQPLAASRPTAADPRERSSEWPRRNTT